MFSPRTVLILVQKELWDARRNRWFQLYAIAFSLLSLALAWLSLAGIGNYGLAGFGRTAAGLVNLVLLIVPLMGLTLGALTLAGERDRGTLLYLLAQPVARLELFLGKFLGLAFALLGTVAIGFAVTGVLVVARTGGGQWEHYLGLALLTMLLALVSVAIGVLISTVVRQGATAVGIALFVWLGLVFFGDLGVMGTAVVLQLDAPSLLALSLINPLQLFKLAAVLLIRNNIEIFGPAGVYASRTYGTALLPALLLLLLAWTLAPTLIAGRRFHLRGGL